MIKIFDGLSAMTFEEYEEYDEIHDKLSGDVASVSALMGVSSMCKISSVITITY